MGQMDPVVWLEKYAHGFQALSNEEREAITYFVFLWSLFEAKTMNGSGSAMAIIKLVKTWEEVGSLDVEIFTPGIDYFKQRYFSGGIATHHFRGLKLRANDNPVLVESVLNGKNNNPAEKVACLFIIIYRLRNNFLHGDKWLYGIEGQLQNFVQSNIALMSAMSMANVNLN